LYFFFSFFGRACLPDLLPMFVVVVVAVVCGLGEKGKKFFLLLSGCGCFFGAVLSLGL
jgi:hypothetical protein